MAVAITSTYNESYHSPGFDLAVSGLEDYDTLTIERVSVPGSFRDTPVRGADGVPTAGDLFGISDYEAPVNDSTLYRATASLDVFEDDFLRTETNGLGVGPAGLAWTIDGTASLFSVSTGRARIDANTIGFAVRHAILSDLELAEFDVTYAVGSEYLATGNNIVGQLFSNYQDVNNWYGWETVFTPGGTVNLTLRKNVAGSYTNYSSVATSVAYIAGNVVFVRCQRVGSELRMKVWAGTPASEPSTWNLVAVDSTFQAGRFGLSAILASGNTNPLPVEVSFDDLRIATLDGSPAYSTSAESSADTIASTDPGTVWLKSVGVPELSRRVNVVDFDTTSRPGRILGEYEVLGKRNKVVLMDVLGGREGSFTIATFPVGGSWWADSFWRDIETLLARGGILLLQTSGVDLTGEEDMYFAVTNVGKKRVGVVGGELVHLHTLDFIEVDRPDTANQSLNLRTWQDVIDQNATWQEVLDNYSTWLDLLQRDR